MFLKGDSFQKVCTKFWSVHKHGSGKWELLALYGHEEILKISSSLKPLVRFWNTFTGMFLGDPFQILFMKFWSVHRHGSGERRLLALYWHEEILKKSSSLNCWSGFEILSQGCSLGDPFQKVFIKLWSINKHGSGEWGHFLLYRHKKFLKNLLLLICWLDFESISQKCSLSGLSQNLLAKFWSVIKHGSSEWRLLSLYGHEQILKNLLWNHRSFFETISQKCSLVDPFQKLFATFWSVSKYGISELGLLPL